MLKKSSLQKFAKSPPLPFKNAKIQDRITPVKSENNPFVYETDSFKLRIEHLEKNLKQETKQRENQYEELLNMINDLKKQNKSKCKHNILVMERSPTREKISKADFANNASIATITSHKQRRDSKCGFIKEINSPIKTYETVENASSRFDQSSANISNISKKNIHQQKFQYVNERINALQILIQTNQKILEKLQQKNNSLQKMMTKNYQSFSRIFQSKIDQIIQDNEVMITQIEEKFQMHGKNLNNLQKSFMNLNLNPISPAISNDAVETIVLKLCKKNEIQISQKIKEISQNLKKYENKSTEFHSQLNNDIQQIKSKFEIELKSIKESFQQSINNSQKALNLQIQQKNQQLKKDFQNSYQIITKMNQKSCQEAQAFNNLQHALLVQKYQSLQTKQKQQIQDLQTKLKDFTTDIKSRFKVLSEQNMSFQMKQNQTQLVLEEIKIQNYKNNLKLQTLNQWMNQSKSQFNSLVQNMENLKQIIQSKCSQNKFNEQEEIQTKQTIIISNSITLIEENQNYTYTDHQQQCHSVSQSSTKTEFYNKEVSKNQSLQSKESEYQKLNQKINDIGNKLQEFIFKWSYILNQKQECEKQISQQKSLSSSRYQDDFFQSIQKRLFDTQEIVSQLMKMTMMLTNNLNKISSSEKQSSLKNKNSRSLKMLRQQLKPIIETSQQVSLQEIDISFTEQNSIQNITETNRQQQHQNSSFKNSPESEKPSLNKK